MRFRFVQWLCPDRHCLVALFFKEEVTVEEALKQADDAIAGAILGDPDVLRSLSLSSALNPWCALCGAKRETWHTEIGWMRETSVAAALDTVREAEAAQQRSAELLKSAGLAYDKARGGWN